MLALGLWVSCEVVVLSMMWGATSVFVLGLWMSCVLLSWTVLFNTPGLKIGSPKSHAHIQNNGHVQTNPSNGHLQINIGHSGHALNSDHVLRQS